MKAPTPKKRASEKPPKPRRQVARISNGAPAITYSPSTALDAATRVPGAHGSKARYVPNLSPSEDPWPVSDHCSVRLEAWTAATDDRGMTLIETGLAGIPGASDHGSVRSDARRPYAWVLLPGDGSYCDHTRERWHRGGGSDVTAKTSGRGRYVRVGKERTCPCASRRSSRRDPTLRSAPAPAANADTGRRPDERYT